MSLHLFAGVSVDDFGAAVAWYEKLFGAPPSSFPHETEAVWELAEGRLVYVVRRPEHAGHGTLTLIVDDLDETMDGIAGRGLEPVNEERYGDGVRKATYTDPAGNEAGFGEVPR
ncbi:VOC family protein [Catenulispora subtropica]|uniref:VOC domain-containing protein n=1 Tax=Catenulispora subtropica TaxID=450798 RepID=A0ABP5DE93_9ACTN